MRPHELEFDWPNLNSCTTFGVGDLNSLEGLDWPNLRPHELEFDWPNLNSCNKLGVDGLNSLEGLDWPNFKSPGLESDWPNQNTSLGFDWSDLNSCIKPSLEGLDWPNLNSFELQFDWPNLYTCAELGPVNGLALVKSGGLVCLVIPACMLLFVMETTLTFWASGCLITNGVVFGSWKPDAQFAPPL